MNEVINSNKYKLKYWFAMLYIHGRKFMIGSVFTYQSLIKLHVSRLQFIKKEIPPQIFYYDLWKVFVDLAGAISCFCWKWVRKLLNIKQLYYH